MNLFSVIQKIRITWMNQSPRYLDCKSNVPDDGHENKNVWSFTKHIHISK